MCINKCVCVFLDPFHSGGISLETKEVLQESPGVQSAPFTELVGKVKYEWGKVSSSLRKGRAGEGRELRGTTPAEEVSACGSLLTLKLTSSGRKTALSVMLSGPRTAGPMYKYMLSPSLLLAKLQAQLQRKGHSWDKSREYG